MKICDIYKTKFTLSFEIFPPVRDGNVALLFNTVRELKSLNPDFISVTYGAGGSARHMTLAIASRIKNVLGQEVLAHLTCIGSNRDDIARALAEFRGEGIENILALRGDLPIDDKSFHRSGGGFAHANELVEYIRKSGDFCIGIAGYPEGHVEAESRDKDLLYLKQKADAGANFVITQLFFSNEDFYRFRDRAENLGIMIPILPGIFPILNIRQIQKILSLCRVRVPEDMAQKMSGLDGKPEETEKYGIEYAMLQARDLIEHGIPGLHFYSMNRSGPVTKIIEGLSLP